MAIRYFTAIVEMGSDGYYASFPDVPGCVTHAASMGDLINSAESALRLHFFGEEGDIPQIPQATDPNLIEADPDVMEVGRILARYEYA